MPTEHLADETKELTASLNRLATEFAEFRGKTGADLGLIKRAQGSSMIQAPVLERLKTDGVQPWQLAGNSRR